jgi:hypothetical protein
MARNATDQLLAVLGDVGSRFLQRSVTGVNGILILDPPNSRRGLRPATIAADRLDKSEHRSISTGRQPEDSLFHLNCGAAEGIAPVREGVDVAFVFKSSADVEG